MRHVGQRREGKGGGTEVRVLCVCATLCVVEEKHIVNGVEHVKQQTGRPRRTTRTVCCHFLCAAGFKVRTRVQGVCVGVWVCQCACHYLH